MKNTFRILLLISLVGLFSACQKLPDLMATPGALPETPKETQEAQPSSADSKTLRTLTVCLGQEPNTLFPYADPNISARTVLGALYDGPIDRLEGGDQPVILETIPTVQNQDLQVITASVEKGDAIVDAYGKVTTLEIGSVVFPSGCRENSCAVTFSGSGKIEMDQMVATFHLRGDIEWSTGDAITADDYLFAYQLAKENTFASAEYLVKRTYSFEALDQNDVQWWGVPGYLALDIDKVLVKPLPKHQLADIPIEDIIANTGTSVAPIGWGPYIFREWVPGNYIRLVKNENYFRANENLPTFDELDFIFTKSSEEAISALLAKKCDVVDSGAHIESDLGILQELQNNDLIKMSTSITPVMEVLDMHIVKNSTAVPGQATTINPLSDILVRQAVGMCVDRQGIVDTIFAGLTEVPNSYVPRSHQNYDDALEKINFDPKSANEILIQAGWVDHDNDPNTARRSRSVSGLRDGTELVLRYASTDNAQRRQIGQLVSKSLAECGIGVEQNYYSAEDFYAKNSLGILFGGNFDLVEYSTGTYDRVDPCKRFLTDQIPAVSNGWLGTNISGYTNSDFDAQCTEAINDAGQSDVSRSASAAAQSILMNELPSLPLFYRIKAVASQPNICDLQLDSTTQVDLWNIEGLSVGKECK